MIDNEVIIINNSKINLESIIIVKEKCISNIINIDNIKEIENIVVVNDDTIGSIKSDIENLNYKSNGLIKVVKTIVE